MFKVYSHDRGNPEADLIFICTCNSRRGANYVISALEYRDTAGRMDKSGLYDYYITEDK